MKNKEKLILIELICERQLDILKNNFNSSTIKEYQELEMIKAKLKSFES